MNFLHSTVTSFFVAAILYVSSADECRFAQFAPGQVHTACLPPKTNCTIFDSGVTQADQTQILSLMNKLRNKTASGQQPGSKGVILPPAANMRELRWNSDLALIAQAHTNQCVIAFDCQPCRSTQDYVTGETLFYYESNSEPQKADWSGPIAGWSDSSSTSSVLAGKYPSSSFAQLVWAQTRDVGCGYTVYFGSYARYRYIIYYTCVFGPSGLYNGEPIYEVGTPCSDCTYRNTCCGSSCNNNADYTALCKLTTP